MSSILPAGVFIFFLLLILLSHTIAYGASYSNAIVENSKIPDTKFTEQKETSQYVNPTHGIKIDYPSDWKPVERANNGYHMLNVVVEFLQPEQNEYYNQTISASHNSLRISVEDYGSFLEKSHANNTESPLQIIGDKRIGSIGLSCPGFDLKSYMRNATLSGSPAYEISLDYTYLGNNKEATEIWTLKDNKVYILNYVANEKLYDSTFPVVKKMFESFKITA